MITGINAPSLLVVSVTFIDAGTGGPGGSLAPPIFGRSVNPFQTGEDRLSPLITTGTLNVFHLPASLTLGIED